MVFLNTYILTLLHVALGTLDVAEFGLQVLEPLVHGAELLTQLVHDAVIQGI